MPTSKAPTKGIGTGHRKKTVVKMSECEECKADPQTVMRVQNLAKMISQGKSRETIQNFVMENYNVGQRQAINYYSAAVRYLLPENEEEYRKGLIQTNIERLENIAETCIENNNYKDAIAAIKEINNIVNPNKNQVTIGKNNLGEEIIQINFD